MQDQLTNLLQIASTDRAFAAILADRSIVTWGAADYYGSDSCAVQNQLNSVLVAAILRGGSVVTWCHAQYGGASRAVQQVFAAITGAGAVASWGHADYGGDSRDVKDRLNRVRQKPLTRFLLQADGSIVIWGDSQECAADRLEIRVCCHSLYWLWRHLRSCQTWC